jgi:hypothetical protein
LRAEGPPDVPSSEPSELTAVGDTVALFHGTDQSGLEGLRAIGEGAIDVRASSANQDLGQGFYLAGNAPTAEAYAQARGEERGGGLQHVMRFDIPVQELGTVVDIRPGGNFRAEWETFLNERPFPELDIVPPGMETNRVYLSGLGVEQRGNLFNRFLESNGMTHADTILAPIGDDVFTGITAGGDPGTQICIRSQAVADRLSALIRGTADIDPLSGDLAGGTSADPMTRPEDVAVPGAAIEQMAVDPFAPGEAGGSEPAPPAADAGPVLELGGPDGGAVPDGLGFASGELSEADLARVMERGHAILDIFREEPGTREESDLLEDIGVDPSRTYPGQRPQPEEFDIGNFSHAYAEELISEDRLPRGLEREFRIVLPDQGEVRLDRVDHAEGIIYEIKPNTPSQIAAGERQIVIYQQYMNEHYPREDGGSWQAEVVTYDRDDVGRFLRDIGWLQPANEATPEDSDDAAPEESEADSGESDDG